MSEQSTEPGSGTTVPRTHHRGLDGLRGVAVLMVLVFHSGLGWLPGGFLGVSLFFTLSGYLIVDLLLTEGERTGRIDLVSFWGRRLRRLAPASIVVISATVGFASWLSTSVEADRVRGDAIAAVTYAANWRFILEGQSYEQLFATPSPLQHLWSLAIEEQMYLVIPVVVSLIFLAGFGRRTSTMVFAFAAAASVVASVVTSRHDIVYYGTHTRAAELLFGAVLAGLIGTRWRTMSVARSRITSIVGAISVLVIVITARVTDVGSSWVYSGALALFASMSVLSVLGSIVKGPTARLLGWSPLVAVGRVSYGLYLVHWPVFVWLNERRLGFGGVGLFAVQLLVTGTISFVSHRVLETPIRERRRLRRSSWALVTFVSSAAVTLVLAVTVLPSVSATPDTDVEVLSTVPIIPTSTITGDETPHEEPNGEVVFDGSGPLRILVIGDSTAENIARGLADVADSEVGVISGGVLGCPLLSTSRVKDRPAGEQDTSYCPDVRSLVDDDVADVDVILLVAGVANQWDYLPVDSSSWVVAGSAEHRRALDELMTSIQKIATPRGVPTLVFDAPTVRDNPGMLGDDPAAVAMWSDIISSWDERWSSIRIVPYADLLSDPNSDEGRRQRPDGVHLDRDFAATLAGDFLIPRIRSAWVEVLDDMRAG